MTTTSSDIQQRFEKWMIKENLKYMKERERQRRRAGRDYTDVSPLLIVAVSSIVSICLTLNILLMTGVI
tara:strand:+ start:210 stop:416 length:207 start_codon:yes stop_codon:yes gene_type:complete